MKISAFAWTLWLSVIVLSFAGLRAQSATGLTVMTVRGPVPAAALGSMLAHEHIMSTFGAEPATRASYDDAVIPPLHALREQGVGTIINATAAFFGRDARLLRTISEQSGIHLVTNTGYYGAANGRYLPAGLATMSAPEVAARWIAEWREGIAGTGVRPGYLKLGVHAGPLREVDRLLIAAAGAPPRPIDWLIREGQARLKAAGFTDADWRQMTTDNPAAAYAVRVRK